VFAQPQRHQHQDQQQQNQQQNQQQHQKPVGSRRWSDSQTH
jgi:hypothetical protein